MQLIRNCPACNEKVSPLTLLGPGFSSEAGPVVCGRCNSVISEPMKKYQGAAGLGMLVGQISGWLIVSPMAGHDLGLKRLVAEIGTFSIVMIVIFVFIYYAIPLRKQ